MKTWSSRPESRIALAVACFLVVHVAIVKESYAAAVLTGLVYAIANLAVDWRSGMGAGRMCGWLAAILVLSATLVAIWLGYASAVALLLAPSLLANAAMFIVFGRTLLPGREPLITRFRRFDIGFVAPKFAAYTRRLTELWTLLFGAGTIVSLLAALTRDIEAWSWVAFVLLPASTAALFLGEHVYRAVRYGPEGRSSPLRTLALMFQPQAWLQPSRESRGENTGHG